MRISGPNRNTRISSKRKTGDASASSGAFKVGDKAQTGASQNASASRSLAAVDALISIQEVPDATARRAKAIARAEDMLDLLEEIKIAILSGGLPRSKLTRLTRIVGDGRAEIPNEKLSGVLDEIELRAKVELAKLEKARMKSVLWRDGVDRYESEL